MTLEEALAKRNDADYKAFLLLCRLKPYVGYSPPIDEEEEMNELLQEMEQVIREREQANYQVWKLNT